MFTAFLAVSALVFTISSCGLSLPESTPTDTNTDTGTNTDTNTDTLANLVSQNFNQSTAETLKTSILSMPESLSVATLTAQKPGNTGGTIRRMAGEGGGYPDAIFGGIRQYIGLADMMKGMVTEVMAKLLPNLGNMPVGELVEIPADPSDPGAPSWVKLEQGTTYDWKVSLYWANNTTPEMIMRFTKSDTGVKGRMLWTMDDAGSDEFALCGYTGSFVRTVDVTFDGTTANKSLEVKLIQGLSGLITYATGLDLSVSTEKTKFDNCDIGQPEKVFLKASHNGTEYAIYGTSYHPGWDDQAAALVASLGADAAGPSFGDGRSMYMFKAKATDTDGAKLYLALPLETMTDTTGVWTNDSISEIFGQMVANMLEEVIQPVLTENPIVDAVLKNAATAVMKLIVPTAADYTHQITTAELMTFASSGTVPTELQSLQDMILSVLALVNPAFYTEADATYAAGFLGTLNDGGTAADTTDDVYYKYTPAGGTLLASTDATFKTKVDTLNAYDLSSVVNYVPADVVSATITVE